MGPLLPCPAQGEGDTPFPVCHTRMFCGMWFFAGVVMIVPPEQATWPLRVRKSVVSLILYCTKLVYFLLGIESEQQYFRSGRSVQERSTLLGRSHSKPSNLTELS